jgi:hypothetical protein
MRVRCDFSPRGDEIYRPLSAPVARSEPLSRLGPVGESQLDEDGLR